MHNDGFCNSFSIFQKHIFQEISEKAHSVRSVSVDGVHAWYIKIVWMMLESPFLELGQTELVSLHYTSDSDSASGECSEPDPLYQEQQHLQSQPWHAVTTVIVMVPFTCPSGPRGVFLFHLRFAHILTFWNLHCFLSQETWSWNWAASIARYLQWISPEPAAASEQLFMCFHISFMSIATISVSHNP